MSEVENNTDKEQGNCRKKGCKGFDYCFWSKLIVAIPAIPIVAFLGASLFTTPIMQMIAASCFISLALVLCWKIDRIPKLQGKKRLI